MYFSNAKGFAYLKPLLNTVVAYTLFTRILITLDIFISKKTRQSNLKHVTYTEEVRWMIMKCHTLLTSQINLKMWNSDLYHNKNVLFIGKKNLMNYAWAKFLKKSTKEKEPAPVESTVRKRSMKSNFLHQIGHLKTLW